MQESWKTHNTDQSLTKTVKVNTGADQIQMNCRHMQVVVSLSCKGWKKLSSAFELKTSKSDFLNSTSGSSELKSFTSEVKQHHRFLFTTRGKYLHKELKQIL